MKYFISAIFGLFICVLALALFAPSFVDLNLYKQQIAQEVKDKAGLDVNIKGDIELALLPSPRFMVRSVAISDAALKQEILSFERFDVNLNLLPLLQGDISVASVTLVRPEITVIIGADGAIIGYTDELKALFSADDSENGSEVTAQSKVGSFSPSISLENIRISDGSITYLPALEDTQKQVISKINMDMKAASVLGPFSGRGSLFYGGRAVGVELSTGAFNLDDNLLDVNAKIDVEPENLSFLYKGILAFDGAVSGQGRLDFGADIKQISTTYNVPLAVHETDMATLGGLLSFDVNNVTCGNCVFEMNGQKIATDLTYNISKGSAVLGLKTLEPIILDHIIKGGGVPAKTVEFDTAVHISTQKGMISGDIGGDTSFVKLDDQNVRLSGVYEVPTAGRPFIGLKAHLKNLDLRSSQHKGTTKQSAGVKSSNEALKSSVRSFVLPFDLAVNASAEQVESDSGVLKNVSIDLEALKNSANIKNISFKGENYTLEKASLKLSDLANISGISSYIEVTTQNLPLAFKDLGLDGSAIPEGFKNGGAKIQITGDLDKMSVTANSVISGAEIIFQGSVFDPLGKMTFTNTAVQVKHSNAARFFRDVSGSDLLGARYSKALDFYTKVDADGMMYTLSDIQADISGIPLSGGLLVDLRSSRPSIEGDLSLGRLILGEPTHTYKGASKAGGAMKSPSSKWSKESFNLAYLNDFDLNLKMDAKSFHYGVWPIENLTTKIALKKGELNVSETKARIFDGAFALDVLATLPQKDRQPIYIDSQVGFENVNLEGLSEALIGKQKISLTGIGSLHLNAKSSGASQAALINELAGEGRINGANIILDGVDLLKFAYGLSADNKLGDSLDALWSGAKSGGTTKFDVLDGTFYIKQGQLTFSKLDLDGEKINIKTSGGVNFPAWTLSTKHTISLKEEGAAKPFGVTLNGPLDDPSQTFGKGLLNDFVNRKIERKLDQILTKHLGGEANDNNSSATAPDASGLQDEEQEGGNTKKPSDKDIAKEVLKGVLGDLLR